MPDFFENIPNELIIKILKKLHQKDLATVAKLDKRFNELADDESLQPIIKIANLTTSKLLFFPINRNSTIADIKQCIENKTGIAIKQQRLLFSSKDIADTKKNHGLDDDKQFLTLINSHKPI